MQGEEVFWSSFNNCLNRVQNIHHEVSVCDSYAIKLFSQWVTKKKKQGRNNWTVTRRFLISKLSSSSTKQLRGNQKLARFTRKSNMEYFQKACKSAHVNLERFIRSLATPGSLESLEITAISLKNYSRKLVELHENSWEVSPESLDTKILGKLYQESGGLKASSKRRGSFTKKLEKLRQEIFEASTGSLENFIR